MTVDEMRYQLEHLKPPRSERDKTKGQLWSASGLSYCLRRQILKAMGIPFPMSETETRFLSMRNAAHCAVEDWICATYPVIQREFVIYNDELRCGGHIDCIVHDDKYAHIIEIKTMAFLKPDVHPYWTPQVSFYLDEINRNVGVYCPGRVVTDITVLLCDLNAKVKAIEPETTKEYLDTLNILNACWDTGVLPPMNGKCDKCQISHICTEPYETIQEFKDAVISYLGETRQECFDVGEA